MFEGACHVPKFLGGYANQKGGRPLTGYQYRMMYMGEANMVETERTKTQ